MVRLAMETVHDSESTTGLPEFSDAALEMRLHVVAGENGEKVALIEEIEQLPSLDLLHPSVGVRDQGRHRNEGVHYLVVAQIRVRGDVLRPVCARPASRFSFRHTLSLQR